MHVDQATVCRIARLARIKITDAEAKALEKELSGILDWVKQLDEVDTKGVEPMTRVVAMGLKKRPDVVSDGDMAGDILAQAPARGGAFFVVSKGGGWPGGITVSVEHPPQDDVPQPVVGRDATVLGLTPPRVWFPLT